VELTPSFPGLPFHEPAHFQPDCCRAAAAPFAAEGVRVACVNGTTDLLDPDLARRHRGLLRLHALIRRCRDFGTPLLVTETGSLSPPSPPAGYAETRTPPAREELLIILEVALELARSCGVTLLLKPAEHHAFATAEDAGWLWDRLGGTGSLGFVLDPAVLLLTSDPARLSTDLPAVTRRLAPLAPVVHAKDLRRTPAGATLPRAGQGELDYASFFRTLRECAAYPAVILEHLRPEEAAATAVLLRGLCELT
jgi:sugar phosphate isomerase/epimerase